MSTLACLIPVIAFLPVPHTSPGLDIGGRLRLGALKAGSPPVNAGLRLWVEEIGRAGSPQIVVPFSHDTVACYASWDRSGVSHVERHGQGHVGGIRDFRSRVDGGLLAAHRISEPDFPAHPETGAVAWWKTGGWVIANTALLSFAVTQLDWRNMFWTFVAFLVIHILIMMSSLRIMYEEKRVMEGSMKPEAMRFSALDAVNDMSILASSVVLYVAGLAALIQASSLRLGHGADPAA